MPQAIPKSSFEHSDMGKRPNLKNRSIGNSNALGLNTGAVSTCGRVTELDRWLVKAALKRAGNPEVTIRLWNGETFHTSAKPFPNIIEILSRKTLWRLLFNPELQFGDAFSGGSVRVEGDLIRVLETLYRGIQHSVPPGSFSSKLSGLINHVPTNSRERSRAHIHHHYDLGNDFYQLWLDPKMLYTCAYYPHPQATLEEAQTAKLDHVCRKLQLKSGQCVVDAGCGWGALAIHMAKHYGVTVQAYNISHQQILFAKEKASEVGVADKVNFIEDDYRNITGNFDAFVSVGMLEHVGIEHYHELGRVASNVLRKGGRGLIHSIGRNAPAANNPWIERRIFPGSYPPSLSEMARIFEPHAFSVLDVENLRMHYAKTCEAWLQRYESVVDTVREMYDEAFVRAWRLYLAGSVAAFTTGSLQLFQVVFAQCKDNSIPLTREHLYL